MNFHCAAPLIGFKCGVFEFLARKPTMFVSRQMIEDALPEHLRQLVNEPSLDNLKLIDENLRQSMADVKNEIKQYRDSSLDIIEPEIKKTETFIEHINDLHKQIDEINYELDEQQKILFFFQINKNMLKYLREFKLNLNEFKISIDDKNYDSCFEILNRLNEFIKQSVLFGNPANNEEPHEILIVNVLKEEFIVQRERLWFEIDLEWDRIIEIDSNHVRIERKSLCQNFMDKLSQFSGLKTSILGNISFVFSNRMKNFCRQFLSLIESTIVNSNTNYKVETKSDSDFFWLALNKTDDEINLDTTQNFSHKLNQIIQVLNFLYENFFKLKVEVFTCDQNENQKECLMNIFSNVTRDEFSKLIHDNLIVNILPLTEFDAKFHQNFTHTLTEFEQKLHKIDYDCQINQQAKQTIDNLEEIYVRKKCKFLIENARNLMKDKSIIFDLVNTKDLNKSIEQFKDDKKLTELIKIQNSMTNSNEILSMPEFSISSFAHQFINLINQTLTEANHMSTQHPKEIKSVSLFCLVTRNLFDLYSSVVPTFYLSTLKELPKLSAILYNDFYYLSLHCLILGHKYKSLFSKLKSMNLDKNEFQYVDLQDLISNFNYVQLAPNLFMTGYEIMYNQVQNQEKYLIEFMHEDCPNGIRDISEENNFELFKKSLQKCILHLKKLASMWRDVLQEELFKKIIGQLLNLVIRDLVKSCLKLEDISTDDASYLHSAFSLMIQAINDLYINKLSSEKSDGLSSDLVNLSLSTNLADLNASKYVESWQKFKHLLVILKANLQEIVDLWTDGMGPLAMHFEPDEVRSLIKALFMNTDRRQAALSKIK
ncbi:centromere kinetochore zw10 -like protein [Brachionus plicatilis]|uniref:Centromere kinetochore zw10-like protein n=1 Tax=Brachionus plicatilis TaxID=10195 RepID=A0A3M7RP39_BRAPC|nr:centromere kinetochore zw10 -like protein [Brachionus plicatilis]